MICKLNKVKTKEKILNAAFELYKEPRFVDISLSEVAQKVGISKAAIYRHYVGKDALLKAMTNQFYDVFANLTKENLSLTPFQSVARMIKFYLVHSEYVGFFMLQHALPGKFEYEMVTEIKSRGVSNLLGLYDVDEKNHKLILIDVNNYAKIVFTFSTVLSFMMKYLSEEKHIASIDEFSEKTAKLVCSGWNCLKSIPETRMKELDILCSIENASIQEEDKVFKALARVVAKRGLPGVTVELLADELGMAKSSLYTYFANKNDMIKNLIFEEIKNMINIIREKIQQTNNFSEYVYVLMRTEFNYFLSRPAVLSVCGWLRLQGKDGGITHDDIKAIHLKKENETDYFDSSFFKENVLDVGLSLEKKDVIKWLATLPISLLIQGKEHQLSEDTLKIGIRNLYELVSSGFIGEIN